MLADSMEASGGELREQRVPDSTHALMSAAMLDAKRARMKVEADREALANRIARLKLDDVEECAHDIEVVATVQATSFEAQEESKASGLAPAEAPTERPTERPPRRL